MFDFVKCSVTAVGLALLPVLLGCNPHAKTVRAYDGPKLPTDQVAVVKDSRDVQVLAIDGKYVGGAEPPGFSLSPFAQDTKAPPRDTFHLAPGPHRLEVRGYRVTVRGDSILTSRGVNAFTLRHDFAAGRQYDLGLEEHVEGSLQSGIPVLRDPGPAGGEQVIVRPQVTPELPARPAGGLGGVFGQAISRNSMATGEVVALLPDTPEARRWVRTVSATDKASRKKARRLPPLKEMAVRSTVGYGVGFFEFPDVRPGRYLIYFQPSAEGAAPVALAAEVRADLILRAIVTEPAAALPAAEVPAEEGATRMSV